MEKTKNAKASVQKKAPIARGTGRRKKAVARVWLRRGKGDVVVNGKNIQDYFDTAITRLDAVQALEVSKLAKQYDVQANVCGGGLCAQAGAVKLGIARALVADDAQLRGLMREHGLMTVDARNKERKKPGQPGARKKFQFVKR